MPLQNRVAPDGSLHENPARGLFTGNRGILHDPETRTLGGRRWTAPAWICCSLVHGERTRDVWGRNGPNGAAGWTELFFLDEVTALAAGHRPCFACRRDAAREFSATWVSAGLGDGSADTMNAMLHGERWLSRGNPPQALSMIDLPGLPDGVVVESNGTFHAMRDRRALPWDFTGYGKPVPLSNLLRFPVKLVTPVSIMKVLRAGYRPAWHESANVTA